MKHLIQKIYAILKKVFFFFRVIVTLEIGKSEDDIQDSQNEDESERS